jgi:type IV pilus assembly protein PilZ
MSGVTGAGGAKQGIISHAIKDKAALYSAYMPFLKGGGLFVSTARRYFLGDEVFMLLTLPESNERLPVAGRVVWVTPPGAQGNRPAGIGVQFPETAEGETVKVRIEALLAGSLTAERSTHTM